MKVFKLVNNTPNNKELTVIVNPKIIKNLNEIINKYIQSDWGDRDDKDKKQFNNDMADDILDMYRIFYP
ncbi:MAG TPA: hypothetical protein VL854_05335 [Nitrososphaeraceae archaeon]|jgi:hypothetical protein|nr:hypothetical protein [Nitrososphaeraceae archaeon]